ncbi:DEAD/DEAH box helicase [Microbacterium lacus]|uniref:DEAD/DEAH box helicase n=1 Tax=Microbacterium lacus TaxID=415217 RepID=UPI00384AE220
MNPPFVDDAHLRRLGVGGAYERGSAYFRDGAVRNVKWDSHEHFLRATVDGGGPQPYHCMIRLDVSSADRPVMSAACTCPVQRDCKHTVAALLASNQNFGGAAPERAPIEAWRTLVAVSDARAVVGPRLLALGVELRQRVRRSSSAWAPIRVETATARGLHTFGSDVLVGLRPLEGGSRPGTWIKGQVSWESLRRPGHGSDPRQSRWFAELFSIARDIRTLGTFTDASEWVTLDDVESGLFWGHLDSARNLGVPLIATKRTQSVRVTSEASVSIQASSNASGITLTPEVIIDGEAVDTASVRPIGGIGLYSFVVHRETIALTLAPAAVPPAASALLAGKEPIVVPAKDADEFVRDHLPALVRQVAVRATGIEVPDPATPTLRISVHFAPSHRLDFTLAWTYPAAESFALGTPTSPGRDALAEEAIRSHVEGVWTQSTTVPFAATGTLTGLEAAAFSANALPQLEAIGDVTLVVSGSRPRYRELTGDPHITVTTVDSPDPDWFDLGIMVTIDGRVIPFTSLFTALSRGKKKLLLSDGGYFSLSHPALGRLRDLIDEAGTLAEWETGPRISRYQTALWSDFEDVADETDPAVSWRATAAALRDADAVPETPLSSTLRAALRPYQRAGFNWLAFLWQHRLGGILADDMGLGKTLQMLALIAHARESGETRPFLVVAPTSVLSTWKNEAARFTPDLNIEILGATRAKRGTTVADAAATADVVITSYTVLRLDTEGFAEVEWAGVVLDEAQFVKNAATRAHRAVRDLRTDVIFAITGTPLENSLTELWALLSLTSPGLFASARRFRDEYVGPIENGKVPENEEGGEYRAARLARLRRRIRPLVLRRTKELVAPELPPKQEQEIRVELGAAHRALYDAVLQRERQKVLGLLDDLDRNRFIVFRSLTLLRMLSLAPGLVDPAHAHITPSKLDALFEQLDEVLAEGHRALVFSQFTSFLALVAVRLEQRGIPYAYLDGSTRDRDAAVAAFREGEAPVFLVSLKAGGFGLTLTEADYVFLLDPWWNPAAEAQAVDRAHRIGQTRSVMVYRLIADGTIEEKVMALQRRKARLFQSVMDDDALFGGALTADDIRGLFDEGT